MSTYKELLLNGKKGSLACEIAESAIKHLEIRFSDVSLH